MTSSRDSEQREIRKDISLPPSVPMDADAHRPRRRWTGRMLERAVTILNGRRSGSEWSGLMELEEARSPTERRLLLIREFSHLADDALSAPPTRRRSWPSAEKIDTLYSAALTLLSCAVDELPSYVNGSEPGEPAANDELVAAIRTLVGYLALQQALQQAPVLDPVPMRLLAREHARLKMRFNETTEWLRET